MRLTAELLTIERPDMTNGNKFDRATAETNVVIDWTDENGTNHATADKVVYTYTLTNHATLPEPRWETNALVVLSGHAYVTNKMGEMRGEPIYWDRIRGVIYTPAFQESVINATNNAGMFGTDAPKTNSHPK
jgi:lipopolysaccharide export system protein LptA